jgi:hypothetical protein
MVAGDTPSSARLGEVQHPRGGPTLAIDRLFGQ